MYALGVCEALAVAIRELDIPVDGFTIVDALALRDRLDARITEALGAFDAAKLWDIDAATSLTAWLRAHGGLTSRSAGRLSVAARRLHQLPVCAAAYADGTLSGGQVEAIVFHLDDATVDLFAAAEAELVPYLAPLRVAGVTRAMASWASQAKEAAEPKDPERSLHLSKTLGDRYVLDGSLDGEGGATVAAALRLAGGDDNDPERAPATRRADALVDIARFFLDHQRSHPGGRHRPHVNVVVNLEDLVEGRGGRVVDGPALDATSISKLLCDCALHRVVMAGGSAILDYGRSTRTIPTPLWNAVVIRDEHCRFPGCDRPSSWCEGHHVVWVTNDGPTNLANIVLLCSRHHHRLHQPGWHATLTPDGAFEVTEPTGRVRNTSPPRTEPAWRERVTGGASSDAPVHAVGRASSCGPEPGDVGRGRAEVRQGDRRIVGVGSLVLIARRHRVGHAEPTSRTGPTGRPSAKRSWS